MNTNKSEIAVELTCDTPVDNDLSISANKIEVVGQMLQVPGATFVLKRDTDGRLSIDMETK